MDVDRLVERIRKSQEEKREAAEKLRGEISSATVEGAHEESFIHGVQTGIPERFTAAGVDGGLATKEFHGLDLIIRRSVAAVFRYEGGELEGSDYFPSKNPSAEMEAVTEGLSREETNRQASLLRLHSEVDAALEAVDSADILMLDGSLLPQMRDRPEEDSATFELYEGLLDKYRELYREAEDSGTSVAGVVEDSRGSRMCNILRENGLGKGFAAGERDSLVLTHLLEPGERTLAAPYSGSNAPVLQDMGLGDSFHVFYLRSVEKDRPVRLEFYTTGNPSSEADGIASMVMSLCNRGGSYGIPPVLIEADQRASLGGGEVEMLTRRIEARLAHMPGIQGLRRESRPF